MTIKSLFMSRAHKKVAVPRNDKVFVSLVYLFFHLPSFSSLLFHCTRVYDALNFSNKLHQHRLHDDLKFLADERELKQLCIFFRLAYVDDWLPLHLSVSISIKWEWLRISNFSLIQRFEPSSTEPSGCVENIWWRQKKNIAELGRVEEKKKVV